MAKTLSEVLDGWRRWGASWKNRALTVDANTAVPFTVPAGVYDDAVAPD